MGDLVGQRIGPYTVTEHIARGGMADVFLANEERLRRWVALKVLLPAYTRNSEFKTRFTREAQATAKLQHPNIIRIFSTDLTNNGDPYFAMEYCPRGTLNRWLSDTSASGKILLANQALALVRQIADALKVAHNTGLVHRDLKPSNILIREDGTPVLADLGIAVVTTATRLTQTGALLGTPQYMSPEQASGNPLDGRSDIYSLGSILYELLAGRRPFDAEESLAVLHQQLYEQPISIQRIRPGLSRQICHIVEKCMQKQVAARYQSAAELVAALDQALTADGITIWSSGSGLWKVPAVDKVQTSRDNVLRGSVKPRKTIQPKWVYAIVGCAVLLLVLGIFLVRNGTKMPSTSEIGEEAGVTELVTSLIEEGPVVDQTESSPTGPTSTVAPIASDTSLPPTDSPVPTNTSRPTVRVTHTSFPSSTPIQASCNIEPYQPFATIYRNDHYELGCPINAGQAGVAMALEDFRSGRMLWRSTNRVIYVLYNTGQWAKYRDTWREGDPTFTCGGPESPPDPMRGFGRVWCNDGNVRDWLGPAITSEWPESGTIQDYENGLIIRLSSGRTYVIYDEGRWRS